MKKTFIVSCIGQAALAYLLLSLPVPRVSHLLPTTDLSVLQLSAVQPQAQNVAAKKKQKRKTLKSQKIETLILQYTNQERQKRKLPALRDFSALQEAARRHSKNMIVNKFFAHRDHLGRSPADRFHEWFPNLIGGMGENLAKFEGLRKYTNDSLAKKMVLGWMQSPPHRKNILNAQYAQLGVGIVYKGELCMGTQNFGTLLGRISKMPPKTVLYGKSMRLNLDFFDIFPRKNLRIFLAVPDKKQKFFINSNRYYTGVLPLDIQWAGKKTETNAGSGKLHTDISFEYGKGQYKIQFGETDRKVFPYTLNIVAK